MISKEISSCKFRDTVNLNAKVEKLHDFCNRTQIICIPWPW